MAHANGLHCPDTIFYYLARSTATTSGSGEHSNGAVVNINWDELGFGIDHMAPVRHMQPLRRSLTSATLASKLFEEQEQQTLQASLLMRFVAACR